MRERGFSTNDRAPALEETDSEAIRRAFVELPSHDVELLATNLARPDGFAKSLVVGRLATSRALFERIGPRFVRTHRGYYKTSEPSYENTLALNAYLSFKVGKTEASYADHRGRDRDEGRRGTGVLAMRCAAGTCWSSRTRASVSAISIRTAPSRRSAIRPAWRAGSARCRPIRAVSWGLRRTSLRRRIF